MVRGERESGWESGEGNGSSEIFGGESAASTTNESFTYLTVAWLTGTEMRSGPSAKSHPGSRVAAAPRYKSGKSLLPRKQTRVNKWFNLFLRERN